MPPFLIRPFLPVVASLAVKSALGSYARSSVATYVRAASALGAVLPSGAIAASALGYLLYEQYHSKLTWFDRKNVYNKNDVEKYINRVLDEIGVSLEDIENKNELVTNIIDEINIFDKSNNDNLSAADCLEAILIHLKKEISDVYVRLPPEVQDELKPSKSDRPKWNDDGARLAGENPPDFIRRIYSDLIGNGLSRNQLRKLDMPLYTALANWLRKNEMPADLDLPTKSEVIDRGNDVDPEHVREARRVLALWSYRAQRASKDHNR